MCSFQFGTGVRLAPPIPFRITPAAILLTLILLACGGDAVNKRVDELAVGDCVDYISTGGMEEVGVLPCDDHNAHWRVIAMFEYEDPYEDLDPALVIQDACPAQYDEFIYPTQDQWTRILTVACLENLSGL